MPRSSRHKSKRSVKEGREYSDTEEETSSKGKRRQCKESGGKRKIGVVKDLYGSDHGNGYSSDDYVGSKKRKVRSDKVGSDRWNGSAEILGVESDIKEEKYQFDDGKVLKSKCLIDLKSKISSSRHDGDTKDGNVDSFAGKEERLCGKVESKRQLERDVSEKEKNDRNLSRKYDYEHKYSEEKEKGSEKDSRSMDSKRELDYRAAYREELKVKKGLDGKDWSLENEYGKHEPEKESDRRKNKRIGEYDDRDKYHDRNRDSSDVNVLSRRDRVNDVSDRDNRHKDITHREKHYWPLEEVNGKRESEKESETRRKRTRESEDKNQEGGKDSTDINMTSSREKNKAGRDRDEKYKDSSSRDKNREYYDRDGKTKNVDKREETDRERRHKYDDYCDDRASRDHTGRKYDSKYARDELVDSLSSRQKKSRIDGTDIDSGVVYDDQCSKYKDVKETRGSMDKEEYSDLKTCGAKEHLEAIKSAGAEEDRSLSFHPAESAASQSQRRRSPSTISLATRDQYRHSKQSDTKYREFLPKERFHSNLDDGKEGNGSGLYYRAHSFRAIDNSFPKGDSGNAVDLSAESHQITDRRMSPVQLTDRSQSPSSAKRQRLGRVSDQRSLDYKDSGHRNSGYIYSDCNYSDGKRRQDRKVEAPSMDASSQADCDNMNVSSSFSRSSRTPGNSRLFHPPGPTLKHETKYAGSGEEDDRGTLNNHPKRSHDSNISRMPRNAWWGANNWPSPMGNGYSPFPHGPGAVGFHSMMQHLPPQMLPGEGFTQGIVDWDQNRSLTASANTEPSVDRYRSVNSATLESPSSNWRATVKPTDGSSSQSNPDLKNEPFHQIDKATNEHNFRGNPSSEMSAPIRENSFRVSNAKVSGEGMKNGDVYGHIRKSCVYLSKIDISAQLAPSDLFEQCMNLLGIKQSNLSDTRISIFSLEEENHDEGDRAKMNTYASCIPVFAEVRDSLLEKLMSLYREHRDETAVNYSSIGNHVCQSLKVQGSKPSPPAPSQLPEEANDQEVVCPGALNERRGNNEAKVTQHH